MVKKTKLRRNGTSDVNCMKTLKKLMNMKVRLRSQILQPRSQPTQTVRDGSLGGRPAASNLHVEAPVFRSQHQYAREPSAPGFSYIASRRRLTPYTLQHSGLLLSSARSTRSSAASMACAGRWRGPLGTVGSAGAAAAAACRAARPAALGARLCLALAR